MFSYRHGFHAGNHADVLKHAMLLGLLDYMGRKDKAFWYIDTHAGAGVYSLTDGFAAKREEFGNGVGKLWSEPAASPPTPSLIARYLDAVRAVNPDGNLRFYPGSPYLAWEQLREQDRMRLFEWHPSEIEILTDNFVDTGGRSDKRTMITRANGFDALRSVMPPPPRRALTLIDPSYEDKTDYARTLEAVEDALRRFATGVFAIWYPIVARDEALAFPGQLRALGVTSWLHATLRIAHPPRDGLGLYGSGMFVINPPFLLEGMLREALPWLCEKLAEDDGAAYTLEAEQP